MDEKWAKHLLAMRQLKGEQIEYLSKGNTTLRETTDGVVEDVTAQWLDTLQREYADISQFRLDSGVKLDA